MVIAGRQMLYLSSEKDEKISLENYRLDSLTSVPEKVMEKILLESISEHIKEKVTDGCTRAKSHLTRLTAFHDEMTGSVDRVPQMSFTLTLAMFESL